VFIEARGTSKGIRASAGNAACREGRGRCRRSFSRYGHFWSATVISSLNPLKVVAVSGGTGLSQQAFSEEFSGGFSRPVVRRIHKVASVQERVIDIVASQLGVSKEQITPETSFINDLGADSLDTVELVMELEEEFEINIPDDAAEKIQTVGQAVEFIEKHQA
jgi:acyl carrier protein